MRVFKDLLIDTQRTGSLQTIPYSLSAGSTVTPKGSILFNSLQNMFYGVGNNGGSMQLSTGLSATINVGVTPAGIAITPPGVVPERVYVCNNNNYGIAGQDSVTVIDPNTNLTIQTITDASFNQPYTITMNAAGTRAYVTNSAGSTVTIINVATNTVAGVITGFDGPSGFVINPANNTAYVNNYGATPGVGSGNGTTVRVVDLNTNLIIGNPITVGQAPAALAITPPTIVPARVYCINYVLGVPNQGTLSVIDTSTNLATTPISSGLSGPFAIAINPTGTRAYVTNFGSNNFAPFGTTISVINITNNTIINTISAGVGIQPAGLAITPDGTKALFSNYNALYAGPNFTLLTPGQGTVNILDLTVTPPVVIPGTIVVGQSPGNITITGNGRYAYVSNFISNTVSVIAI